MKGRPRNIVPILPVSDIQSTLDWYEHFLGASDRWVWGDPVNHAGCMLGAAAFHFGLDPELALATRGLSFFVNVYDLDTYYAEVRALGAPIAAELERKPWGVAEFVVEDLNGVRLRFSEFGAEVKSTEPLAVRLERRPLTPEENKKLVCAVGWDRDGSCNYEARPERLFTVVALAEGEVVGAASVTGNGIDTFHVRDVMVLPEFQGKTVGTQLMREVVTWIEEAVPAGEFVTLLTGATTTKFYERVGFLGPDGGLTGMYLKR